MTVMSEETMTASSTLRKMYDSAAISGRDEMIEEKTAINMRNQILDGVISKLETTCVKGNLVIHIGIMDDMGPIEDTTHDAMESKGFVLKLICLVSFLKHAWISYYLSRFRCSYNQEGYYVMPSRWVWYTTHLRARDITTNIMRLTPSLRLSG
jgi:hypothetical protein